MKIILLEDVRKQGKKGDILEVKDGYGAFLIKNKQAVVASKVGVDRLEKENLAKQKEEEKIYQEALQLKEKLSKVELKFSVKTGAMDKVFGSVSPKQIADALKEKGYAIDKKQVKEKEPLSTLGYHQVEIELHKKVHAVVRVNLEK